MARQVRDVDNGLEHISSILKNWAENHRVLHLTGKATANIERYNRTVRHEWLGTNLFNSIKEGQDYATKWHGQTTIIVPIWLLGA